MKTIRHSRAFTLLEIMVALGLLSMIIVAIYSSWHAIIKGSKVAREVAAASQRMRITMHTLQDSLLCACMFTQNSRYYTFLADSQDDFSSFSFVARLPKTFPRSGKFGDLDVRRLAFTIENGPDSRKQLVLRQNPLLMDVDKDEQENPLVLARDVDKFIVEYIDPKSGEWNSEWLYSNQLPREVRVQLALGHPEGSSSEPLEVMVGTVAIPSQQVLGQWQMPLNGPSGPRQPNGATNAPPRAQPKLGQPNVVPQ